RALRLRFGLDLRGSKRTRHKGQQPQHCVAADFFKQEVHGIRSEQSSRGYSSFGPCRVVHVVEPKLSGGLFHSLVSRAVARSASTLTAATRPVSTIPARPITYREQPRHNMAGRQIAVTDGETGHKGEIKSVIDAPPLYVPDQKSGSDHCEK